MYILFQKTRSCHFRRDINAHCIQHSRSDVSKFADAATISGWATEPVSWAVGAGLINGRDGNLIAPQGTATRAEAATMLWKFSTGVMGI